MNVNIENTAQKYVNTAVFRRIQNFLEAWFGFWWRLSKQAKLTSIWIAEIS